MGGVLGGPALPKRGPSPGRADSPGPSGAIFPSAFMSVAPVGDSGRQGPESYIVGDGAVAGVVAVSVRPQYLGSIPPVEGSTPPYCGGEVARRLAGLYKSTFCSRRNNDM